MRPTELDLSSPAFDQVFHEGVAARIFILSQPRCGSYMLCRLMLQAGLGVPHEYFNPLHMKLMGERFRVAGTDAAAQVQQDPTILHQYMRFLLAFRTRSGVFAAKVQLQQFRWFLDTPVNHRLLDGARFVYLSRDDMLGQAISWRFAQLTGRWGFEPEQLTEPVADGDFFDIPAIDELLGKVIAERLAWEGFFARNDLRPVRLSYEKLCRHPVKALRRIAAACGRDPATLPNEVSDGERYAVPAGIPSKELVRKAYIYSRRVVSPAPNDGTLPFPPARRNHDDAGHATRSRHAG